VSDAIVEDGLLRVPKGHTITADDVRRLNRALVEFRPAAG
jgi:hypothetical protein